MLKKLRARLAALKADAKKIIDSADAQNDGVMTEEQTAEFDRIMAEVDGVQSSIDQREKLEKVSADDLRGSGRQTEAQTPTGNAHIEVIDRVDPMSGFKDMADFACSVQKACAQGGRIDERLNVMSAPGTFHRETNSSDGYEVPPQMRNEVWKMVFEDEADLLSLITSEPTSGNQVKLLADETTPWGATGIQANWASEGAKMDPSRLSTKARIVELSKLYAFVLATEELLEDGPLLANRLTSGAAAAIRWKLNDSIMYGNGAGKMLGYFNSPALVSVAKETSQVADTIVAMNIAKMFSRMLSSSIGRAIWLANSDIIPQLIGLVIGDKPVWLPPQGLAAAPGGYILGRPLLLSDHAKTVGDKGDLQFIDPKGYYAATKKQGIKMSSSIHLFFDYDIEAFKWTFRVGGQPFLSAPVSPANGNNTKSHFVVLDERA